MLKINIAKFNTVLQVFFLYTWWSTADLPTLTILAILFPVIEKSSMGETYAYNLYSLDIQVMIEQNIPLREEFIYL